MVRSQLPLRQYLETINDDCSSLDQKQLIQIILGLAKEVQSNGRRGFLNKLAALLPEGGQQGEGGMCFFQYKRMGKSII